MMKSSMNELVPYIDTAGGNVHCARCQAVSKRTHQQCKAPAERGKWVCRFHGARSTGPRTEEGRLRVARGKVKHGNETRQARAERSKKLAELAEIEDMMHVLGLTDAKRTRGRKPSHYQPIKTLPDAVEFVTRQLLEQGRQVAQDNKKIKLETS